MPSNRKHVKDQRRILGPGPWKELNRWMDQPAQTMGPKHRKLRHLDTDPSSVFLGMLLYGPEAPMAMLIHTLRDRMESEMQRAISQMFNYPRSGRTRKRQP